MAAAGSVFAARGYHGATLDDILVAAGVSKGALYHYFPSKEALFLALLDERLNARMKDAGAVAAEHGGDHDAIGSAANGFLRGVSADPRWLPLLLEFLAYGARDQTVRERIKQTFIEPARDQIVAMLRATGIDSDKMSAAELGVVGSALINGLAIEEAFDPGSVPADLPLRLMAVIAQGCSTH